MPASSPELPYTAVTSRMGRSLTVAGHAADGDFIVPLDLVGVSPLSTYNRLDTFTAELVGPLGTRLTAPGRYLTIEGGDRFCLTLSWVTRRPDGLHYRATFVHRVASDSLPLTRAAQLRTVLS